MKISFQGGFVSSTIHLPLLLLSLFFLRRGMNVILFFLFRGCSAVFATTILGLGLMDVYVNDPKKMNQSELLLEALNLSKLTMQRMAMCLEFGSMALEWVMVKSSIRVCLVLVFSK